MKAPKNLIESLIMMGFKEDKFLPTEKGQSFYNYKNWDIIFLYSSNIVSLYNKLYTIEYKFPLGKDSLKLIINTLNKYDT